jgi:5-methyltetrahydrofolate--homocysteine methyltransferase
MHGVIEALTEKPLLCDGAMGTQLQLHGLKPGECGDSWNVDYPDRVRTIQKGYVDAGADCLTSNTFGACRIALQRHGYADQVREINEAAVHIAREAFGAKRGFVLGDIGPFGGLMEPFGNVSAQEVREAFREQAQALVGAGVDAIIIETQTDLSELGIALEESREAGAACVIASVSYDVIREGTDVRTMMGISPEEVAAFAQENGADVIGTNCGTGVEMEWAARILLRYRTNCDLPLLAQPNAGKPSLQGLEVVYEESSDEFAQGVGRLVAAGARIVGACCGSTPDHISKMREELDSYLAAERI